MIDRNANQPEWTVRRRIIFTTLLFCAGAILYIMLLGEDSRVNEAIVLGCFSLSAAVIGSYVFSATWADNTSKNIHLTNRRSNVTFTSETPSQRKDRARARLARMRERRAAADNPDS